MTATVHTHPHTHSAWYTTQHGHALSVPKSACYTTRQTDRHKGTPSHNTMQPNMDTPPQDHLLSQYSWDTHECTSACYTTGCNRDAHTPKTACYTTAHTRVPSIQHNKHPNNMHAHMCECLQHNHTCAPPQECQGMTQPNTAQQGLMHPQEHLLYRHAPRAPQ